MDKRDIVEIMVGLWLLAERYLTARKTKALKADIDKSLATVAAHVPTLAAAFDRAKEQAATTAGTIEYSKDGPRRVK